MGIKRFDTAAFSTDVFMYRVEKKLTRPALIRKIGAKHVHTISEIENGGHRPSLDIAYNLCELMQIPLDSYMKVVDSE